MSDQQFACSNGSLGCGDPKLTLYKAPSLDQGISYEIHVKFCDRCLATWGEGTLRATMQRVVYEFEQERRARVRTEGYPWLALRRQENR